MYAKLFASIYHGTLRGNADGLLVFTNLLAHCDAAGVADVHPKAIAEEVGITLERVEAALAHLSAPDPESRTPDEQGRRIILLDKHRSWGWKVVNHGKYRAIRNEVDRREQNRQAVARFRAKSKTATNVPAEASAEAVGNPCNPCKPRKPRKAHTEADVKKTTTLSSIAGGSSTPPAPPPKEPKVEQPSPGALTWNAYAAAYEERYGTAPKRNAKVNGQLAQLVARLGAEEAPRVAAFYVSVNRNLYVSAGHVTDLLLRDAERLHTDWKLQRTGDVVTQSPVSSAKSDRMNELTRGRMGHATALARESG